MKGEIFKGDYKGVKFRYSATDEEGTQGILIINLNNGIESTHIIKKWGIIRIMQYIESMIFLV